MASLVLLSGCGGGDDDRAGGLTEFSVQPAEVGFSVPAAVPANPNQPCASGVSAKVFVFGGAPPYAVKNASIGAVVVDKALVDNEGGDFTITFVGGGCLDPGLVIVEDSLRRVVTVTLTNTIGTGS